MRSYALGVKTPRPEPVVELVLGAGNVSSIVPRDLLYGMFVENRVVVLKCNPVNDYLARHWERALRALVEGGFLRIVTGDAAAGAYLVGHRDVGHIHMTGSDKTFEAVVFGADRDGAARKARGERLVRVPVTIEGGNVSPVIIVPGRWSASDLRYQAAHVATMLANNAGFNCNAARVLITATIPFLLAPACSAIEWRPGDRAAGQRPHQLRRPTSASSRGAGEAEARPTCLLRRCGRSGTATHVSAPATKPTQPGHGKLLELGSTGSKKAIGASQVGICLGTCVQRRLAPSVELSAHLREVAAGREMHVPSQKQVCARDAPGLALLLARERWLTSDAGTRLRPLTSGTASRLLRTGSN